MAIPTSGTATQATRARNGKARASPSFFRADAECHADRAKYRQGWLRAETREDQKSRHYASESISNDGEEIDEANGLSCLIPLPKSKKRNEREARAHQ